MFLFMMSAVDTTRTAELAEDLFEQFGLAVSEETVRQELHKLRLTNKVVAPLDKRAFTPDNVLSAPPWVDNILFARRLVWLSSCKCWMYARVCGSAFLAFTERMRSRAELHHPHEGKVVFQPEQCIVPDARPPR
jgi:hypothetical protein